MSERYVVLGLANVRASWFREVGRWATAAAIPVEFVRCVSAEETRARFASGRSFSALLVDAGVTGVDRDLIDVAVEAGAAVIVVEDGRSSRDWRALGATAVLPADFDRGDLLEELERHASTIGRADSLAAEPGAHRTAASWSGRLVAVTGSGGTGASTVAIALAQGIGRDPRHRDLVLLADLALHAEQAMLHDARDVIPGLQELVEVHRTGFPTRAEIRSLVFDVPPRSYHLLLGLRRHRDWTTLRPRAVQAALDSLRRAYRAVVADVDCDLEGDEECGSTDVEERNILARATMDSASLVVIVGLPTMKGLHATVRVLNDVIAHGAESERVLVVLNRAPRAPRHRSELTAVLGDLVRPVAPRLAAPIFLPDRPKVEDALRDGTALPTALSQALAAAVLGTLERVGAVEPHGAATSAAEAGPVPVRPGELGHWTDDA